MNDVKPERIEGGNKMVILVHLKVIKAVNTSNKRRKRVNSKTENAVSAIKTTRPLTKLTIMKHTV